MKPLVACAFACALMANAATVAAQALPAGAEPTLSPNEQAGLPNLAEVNRPNPASASAKVELNEPRKPSFYQHERDGTVITEYRDHGKAPEIDVQSSFGTHYQMTAPADISPQMPGDGPTINRLPSIKFNY